jgi:hypothetical protein
MVAQMGEFGFAPLTQTELAAEGYDEKAFERRWC